MTIAGSGRDELNLIVQENVLIVIRRAGDPTEQGDRQLLYRNIAKHTLERRFHLADAIKVTNAAHKNKLPNVSLIREVPEHRRPRRH